MGKQVAKTIIDIAGNWKWLFGESSVKQGDVIQSTLQKHGVDLKKADFDDVVLSASTFKAFNKHTGVKNFSKLKFEQKVAAIDTLLQKRNVISDITEDMAKTPKVYDVDRPGIRSKPHGMRLSSRLEAEEFYNLDEASASLLGYTFNNSGGTKDPKWRLVKKDNRAKQAEVRKQRLERTTEGGTKGALYKRGEEKIKAINAKDMEAHHIIPTDVSDKIQKSMSPEEWTQRVIDDKKRGIYHGNDPKNLVAARHSEKLPNTTAGKKSQVWHREGDPDLPGYHTLEAQIKKQNKGVKRLTSYSEYRDLMSQQLKMARQPKYRQQLRIKQ